MVSDLKVNTKVNIFPKRSTPLIIKDLEVNINDNAFALKLESFRTQTQNHTFQMSRHRPRSPFQSAKISRLCPAPPGDRLQ
jgi:hypothetical protein